MKKISAENTSFYLWTREETKTVNPDELPLMVQNTDQLRLKDIYSGNDIRLVLFQSFLSPQKGYFYWLYWKESVIPENLDSIINEEKGNMDRAFENSVRTFFQQTECSVCARVYPSLIIPPGDPYPGAPGLLENKIKNYHFLKCPNCSSILRQMVVKII